MPSSSPLSHRREGIKRLEDAGAAAVVLYPLFEEQISLESYYIDYYLNHGTNSFPEAQTYFPEMEHYNVGPDDYLNLIRRSKTAADIPIIGSLNGISTGGWGSYASLIEEAGADALELNVYFIATDALMTSQEIEDVYVDVLREVKRAVTIPVAMKLSPYFNSTPNVVRRPAEWVPTGDLSTISPSMSSKRAP